MLLTLGLCFSFAPKIVASTCCRARRRRPHGTTRTARWPAPARVPPTWTGRLPNLPACQPALAPHVHGAGERRDARPLTSLPRRAEGDAPPNVAALLRSALAPLSAPAGGGGDGCQTWPRLPVPAGSSAGPSSLSPPPPRRRPRVSEKFRPPSPRTRAHRLSLRTCGRARPRRPRPPVASSPQPRRRPRQSSALPFPHLTPCVRRHEGKKKTGGGGSAGGGSIRRAAETRGRRCRASRRGMSTRSRAPAVESRFGALPPLHRLEKAYRPLRSTPSRPPCTEYPHMRLRAGPFLPPPKHRRCCVPQTAPGTR